MTALREVLRFYSDKVRMTSLSLMTSRMTSLMTVLRVVLRFYSDKAYAATLVVLLSMSLLETAALVLLAIELCLG